MTEIKHGMGDAVKQEETVKPKPQTCFSHCWSSGLQRLVLLEQSKTRLAKQTWNFDEHST